MSAAHCINQLEADGTIDRDKAAQFRLAFDDLERTYKRQFGSQTATSLASAQLVRQLEAEAQAAARQKLLQLGIQRGILMALDRAASAGASVGRTARAFFSSQEGVAGIANIDLRHSALTKLAWSKMDGFLAAIHRKIGGVLNAPALMDNIVRELHGEATGDVSARQLAEAFTNTAEWLRGQYNAAGGSIAKLDKWGLPQAHDTLLVRKASFEDWRDFILPKLDRARMVDDLTGMAFSDQRLELALRDVYEHIRTDGFDQMVPGAQGGSKLANRRLDHRFLHFKDADSWLAYQQRFGTNAFDAITGHIDSMSRDIASMQVLGPNPAYTVAWLGDVLKQDAAVRGGVKQQTAAALAAHAIDRMWGTHTGELNRSVNPVLTRRFAAVRQWNGASKLGSAVLTGSADFGFTHAMANYNGLEATRLVGRFAKGLTPAAKADRELAMRTGLIGHEHTLRATELWKCADRTMKAHEVARRVNDGVMRLSGLSTLTTAGLHATGLEFMQSVAEHAGQRFAELEPKLQRVLARYGIGDAMWDTIRSTPQYQHEGVGLVRPDELATRPDLDPARANEAATRFYEMIEGEKRFGMPDAGASLNVRAALNVGQKGTWIGELLQSATQIKQFPVSVIDRSLQRAIHGDGTPMDRAKFAANAFIATTVMGALVLQMKDIAQGKDPEPMLSPAFFFRAAMQGGALGIYGDYLKGQVSQGEKTDRNFHSIGDILLGPTIQSVFDPISRLALHDTSMATADEIAGNDRPSTAGREITQFLKQNTPGSSLWYARLAFNRLIWDQLQALSDPHARGAFDRQEQRAQEEDRTRFWWAPGETAPERAPELGNAGAPTQ